MKYKYFIPILIVFACSFISIANLFHAGFPLTHDGDVHLLRLTNFYQSLKEGNSIPRWAANVNFGYGQPVFEFFYPFPSYLASLFHSIGFSFADSLKIILILSMVLSGLAMYLWLSHLFNQQSGIVGGLLYVFAPFRFVDTYVRGDIGESFAFVFLPLVLFCIYKIEKKPSAKWVILGALSFALLILTHNVLSLMFLPFILLYGIFCWFHHNKKKLFGGYFLWLLIAGFALSAFFWMPGLVEGKYTLRNIVTKGEYKTRFVDFQSIIYGKWSYGGTGDFTVQMGILQWVAFIGSGIVLLLILRKKEKNSIFILGTWIYTLSGIFFMLPVSNSIWSKILLLQNFQFPWRFLAITVFSTAVLGAYLVSFIPKKYSIISVMVLILLILFLNKDYMHAKAFANRPDNYFAGVKRAPADTGESTPIWGVRFMEEGYKNPLALLNGDAYVSQKKRTTTEHIYSVEVHQKTRFIEHTLYFPGWKVFANGKEVPVEFQDQQHRGIMTFYLDPGRYTVDVKFTDTKFRKFADALSFISIIIIITFACYLMGRKLLFGNYDKLKR